MTLIAFQDPLGQLPTPASTFAEEVDPLFTFLTVISIFFFTLILVVLVYSAIRYRRRRPDQPPASQMTHNTTLEVVWTLIPTVILMVTFAWGLKGNLDQQIVPADARAYTVEAWKWAWAFHHPGDDPNNPQTAAEDLYCEIGVPVRITMTSRDVLHSLYIPAFRVKRDVVPGVRQILWFRPTELGTYDLFCAEYCGDGHSLMRRKVHVVDAETFAKKPWIDIPQTPEGRGEKWYTQAGCIACHSLTDQITVGPVFKGIWMRPGQLQSGESYVADADYIRNSIRNPASQLVAGRPNWVAGAMPQFTEAQLTDEQIDDLIAWMKTLK
ncbi:MAG: cytochrome c oxidase subunit II [Planctomycetes bacterium]|nr:cytochrome c oxidase subunit II [Planctomycetota bacterium]